ncbi:cbb3-type cytochrome oxidase subunit 3 [Magnetofaba australis]|nr:cbb3-type cytochrome c oxidase subunit 3 [Magnetofaba australis]
METVSILKQFGLVWFFVIFLIIIGWAYWPSHKKDYDKAGRLALDDDKDEVNSAAQEKDGASGDKESNA